jgi:hypothetical protein
LEARPTNEIILAFIGWIVKAILAYSSRPIGLPNFGRASNGDMALLLRRNVHW